MKTTFILLTALLIGFVSCDNEEEKEYVVMDCSKVLSQSECVWIGQDTTNLVGYYYMQHLQLPPFRLLHSFSSYGFGFGFTVCNKTDVTTRGYTNLSAITGRGVKSDCYLTVSAGGANYGLPANIVLDAVYQAENMYVTNAVYPYVAITEGDDGYGEWSMVKKWTPQDCFSLTVNGFRSGTPTGNVTVLLADGMKVVNNWQMVDLTQLGRVDSVTFSMTSTDMGEWGMNTPAYFCMDQFTVSK